VAFLAFVHLALFLALSLSPGNSQSYLNVSECTAVFRSKYYRMHCHRRLFCLLSVVRGLSNFAVGMPSVMPTGGRVVDANSYPVCGTWNGVVRTGLMASVDCPSSTEKFRYVVVQSLHRHAINLCIAEVAVYEGGLCAVTFVFEQPRRIDVNNAKD